MALLAYPAHAVDCTSEIIRVSLHECRETRITNISVPHANVVPVLVPSVPARSPEFMQFAEQLATRLPKSPAFSEDWMNELVDNFAQFDD